MTKHKIAFLSYRSDPYSGGQGVYLKNVCEALAKFGHEITIYSGNPLPRVEDNISVIEVETPQYFDTFDFGKRIELFRTRKKDLFEFQDFFEAITGTFSEPIFFGERLRRNKHFIKNKENYDIFHDNQSLSLFPDIISNRLVTTFHHPIQVDRRIDLDNEESILKKLSIRRWYSFLNFQKKNLQQSRMVVTPSQNSKKDIHRYYDFPETNIEVLWNGINLEDYKFREKENFQNNLVTIISSDVPMKNLANILKGFYEAQKNINELTLTIIGDVRNQNINLIDQLGIKKKVFIKRKLSREKLISTLSECDIGISGSLYEGFGFPLIEMIAIGLPIISSNRGSLPELMGHAGISFNPKDSRELAHCIEKLVLNEDMRAKISKNCKERRDDFFGWDEYARKLEFLYQKIINGHI